MSYTSEQIKSMGKRELLEVGESFGIEMDTSTPKDKRQELLLEFFKDYKGPEADVEWEDDEDTQTGTESQASELETPTVSDEVYDKIVGFFKDYKGPEADVGWETGSPVSEPETLTVSDEVYDKIVELSEAEPKPLGDKLAKAAERLDNKVFDDVTKAKKAEAAAKKELLNDIGKRTSNEEKSDETKTDTSTSQEKTEESAPESHDVEEFTLKQAALGRITQYQPGVAFIKKDGSGKDRGVVPVHKKVYNALVAAHDGKKCQFELINLKEFDNVEKLSIARVVKNLIDYGHVYIRSNHSSAHFYL